MSTDVKERSQSEAPAASGNGSEPAIETGVDERLVGIERELSRQGREAKKTRQAYGIFAVMAVVIALVNLLVLAVKLDKKDTATAGVSQAVSAAKPVASGPLEHTSAATLKEYSITPRPSEVAAGRVTFKVHNAGAINHEFVVLRTNKKASELLKGSEADESGNVGEIGDLQPGQTKTLSLNLKAGHYALICNLAGHYKAGQHADLTVR
ncbi:MAG TPA: hypothetical protein VF072_13915 [Thermoleophilaceae bacterium]